MMQKRSNGDDSGPGRAELGFVAIVDERDMEMEVHLFPALVSSLSSNQDGLSRP